MSEPVQCCCRRRHCFLIRCRNGAAVVSEVRIAVRTLGVCAATSCVLPCQIIYALKQKRNENMFAYFWLGQSPPRTPHVVESGVRTLRQKIDGDELVGVPDAYLLEAGAGTNQRPGDGPTLTGLKLSSSGRPQRSEADMATTSTATGAATAVAPAEDDGDSRARERSERRVEEHTRAIARRLGPTEGSEARLVRCKEVDVRSSG